MNDDSAALKCKVFYLISLADIIHTGRPVLVSLFLASTSVWYLIRCQRVDRRGGHAAEGYVVARSSKHRGSAGEGTIVAGVIDKAHQFAAILVPRCKAIDHLMARGVDRHRAPVGHSGEPAVGFGRTFRATVVGFYAQRWASGRWTSKIPGPEPGGTTSSTGIAALSTPSTVKRAPAA